MIAMQLCIAKGANVYVSSSSEDKIKRAIGLGAKGGVNYNSSELVVDSSLSAVCADSAAHRRLAIPTIKTPRRG